MSQSNEEPVIIKLSPEQAEALASYLNLTTIKMLVDCKLPHRHTKALYCSLSQIEQSLTNYRKRSE